MNRFKLIDVIPPLFWQITIALIVFSSSAAGYYTNQSYIDFMSKGWSVAASQDDILNPLSIIGTIGSIICAFILLLRFPFNIPPLIVIILPSQVWLATSSLWSNTIAATLMLVGKTLIYTNALDCAISQLDSRAALRAFTWTVAVMLLASLALCITDPVFRISIGADGWRGLFSQKNRLSSFCLFSAPIIFFCIRFSPILSSVTLTLSIFMIAVSQGKSAIGILLAASIIFMLTNLVWRGREEPKITMIFVFVSFWLAFLISLSLIVYQINVGALDFTGRASIWAWYIDKLGDNMLLGMGGMTAAQDPAFVAAAASEGMPNTSDSSYIMILFNNGIIGLIIFFGTLIGICISCIQKNSRFFIYPMISAFCYVTFAATESDTRFFPYYSTFALLALYAIANKMMRQDLAEANLDLQRL